MARTVSALRATGTAWNRPAMPSVIARHQNPMPSATPAAEASPAWRPEPIAEVIVLSTFGPGEAMFIASTAQTVRKGASDSVTSTRWLGRLHAVAGRESRVPFGEAGMALAPVARGVAEIEVGERAAERDLTHVERSGEVILPP